MNGEGGRKARDEGGREERRGGVGGCDGRIDAGGGFGGGGLYLYSYVSLW